jgi:hypothetical protein
MANDTERIYEKTNAPAQFWSVLDNNSNNTFLTDVNSLTRSDILPMQLSTEISLYLHILDGNRRLWNYHI